MEPDGIPELVWRYHNFDKLPERLRVMLRDAPCNLDPFMVLKMYRLAGEDVTVAAIQDAIAEWLAQGETLRKTPMRRKADA